MPETQLRRSSIDHTPKGRKALTIDGDAPNDVLQTLSSDTAQAILGALENEPQPLSEISEVVGTSVQNTHYHVDRLVEASLIEPVDVWYSTRGREMSVYALAFEELLVQFGNENK